MPFIGRKRIRVPSQKTTDLLNKAFIDTDDENTNEQTSTPLKYKPIADALSRNKRLHWKVLMKYTILTLLYHIMTKFYK